MSRSTKNIIAMLIAVALIGGLTGLYLWLGSRQPASDAEGTPAPTPVLRLIENGAVVSAGQVAPEDAEAEVDYVEFTSGGQTLTLKAERVPDEADPETTETHWSLMEEPGVLINQSAAEDMTAVFTNLNAAQKVADTAGELAGFGLNPPLAYATAAYLDGTSATVRVGSHTPAGDRYYAMIDGDPALYLIYTHVGDRFFNGLNELMDTSFTLGTSEAMEHVLIAERGKTPIEFGFYGTEEEKAAMVEALGAAYMSMISPYPGREVYFSSFDNTVFTEFTLTGLGDLVELNAADNLSEYGLDAPSLELRFSSAESDTHILFGDRINEDGAEKIYCQFAGSDQVYKADYESVQIMYGLNPLPFINRFIALTDIKECAAVDFDFPGDPERNVRITLEHGTAPPKEGEETGTDFINATVNGQAVEEDAFRTFYRLIIGLIFDADIGEYAPGEGSRALSLTYTMTDGSRNVIHFYPYDNSFYAVETEGEPIRFVISRRTVELIFDALPGLLGE